MNRRRRSDELVRDSLVLLVLIYVIGFCLIYGRVGFGL
jgi:hypothetical protein